MNTFSDYLLIVEILNNVNPSATMSWGSPPRRGSTAEAYFRVGNFGYWLSLQVKPVGFMFNTNKKAFSYWVSFDVFRDKAGQPIPIHQLPLDTRGNPKGQSILAAMSNKNKDAGFKRTSGNNAPQVFSMVLSALKQFVDTVKPEALEWTSADDALGRMYRLFTKRYAAGQYMPVGRSNFLVRSDLVPDLAPAWANRQLQAGQPDEFDSLTV